MKGLITGVQNLINGIQTIINGIVMGIQFLINLVKSILDLGRLLLTIIGQVMNFTITLPTWMIAFITATLSVAVLYQILGRESGK